MRRPTIKIIVATTAAASLLGAGVATAADPPTCPYGNTPQAGQVVKGQQKGKQLRQHRGAKVRKGARAGDRTQRQLRKRDGTGPYHEQNVAARR